MSQRNNSCDCSDSSSGFVFGLICGTVIAALVAIYVYKNPKSEVVTRLRKKFEDLFKTSPSSQSKNHKKPVILPPSLAVASPPPVVKPKAQKFLKAKK